MRRAFLPLLLCLTLPASGQNPRVTQTPRQALQEILFAGESASLVKHMPSAVLLHLSDEPALANLVNEMRSPLAHFSDGVQTFDDGPILAVVESGKDRFEFTIDTEESRGDEAQFEVGLRALKDDEGLAVLLRPQIFIKLQMEDGVWRIGEGGVTIRLKLNDPETVDKYFRVAARDLIRANEASAVGTVRTIVTAQVTYAATWPEVGFVCNLAALGPGDGEPNQHQSGLIDSVMASGRKRGYLFTLSGCSGQPSTTFLVTAVPEEPDKTGRRAFCSDQSGVLRFSDDGGAESCLANNEPLQ